MNHIIGIIAAIITVAIIVVCVTTMLIYVYIVVPVLFLALIGYTVYRTISTKIKETNES